jgi:hypothetical protein
MNAASLWAFAHMKITRQTGEILSTALRTRNPVRFCPWIRDPDPGYGAGKKSGSGNRNENSQASQHCFSERGHLVFFWLFNFFFTFVIPFYVESGEPDAEWIPVLVPLRQKVPVLFNNSVKYLRGDVAGHPAVLTLQLGVGTQVQAQVCTKQTPAIN